MLIKQNNEIKLEKKGKYIEFIHPAFSNIKLFCLVTCESETSINNESLDLFYKILKQKFEALNFNDFYSVSRKMLTHSYGSMMVISQKIFEDLNNFFIKKNELDTKSKKLFSLNLAITDGITICINSIGKAQTYCLEQDNLILTNNDSHCYYEYLGEKQKTFFNQYIVENDIVEKIIFINNEPVNYNDVLNDNFSNYVQIDNKKNFKQKVL